MPAQRAYKRRPAGGSRNAAIAAIQICWKQMRGFDGDSGESREERLWWIERFLKIKDLRSITDLTDAQLGAVAGEMKRLTGRGSGQPSAVGRQPVSTASGSDRAFPVSTASGSDRAFPVSTASGSDRGSQAAAENVVQGNFDRESQTSQPRNSATSETIHLASTEQVYTLEKLVEFIGWGPAATFNYFMQRGFGTDKFSMLTFAKATKATNMLLHIAAHRALKERKGGVGPVSRIEINKYIPILKEQLGIDQRR